MKINLVPEIKRLSAYRESIKKVYVDAVAKAQDGTEYKVKALYVEDGDVVPASVLFPHELCVHESEDHKGVMFGQPCRVYVAINERNEASCMLYANDMERPYKTEFKTADKPMHIDTSISRLVLNYAAYKGIHADKVGAPERLKEILYKSVTKNITNESVAALNEFFK